MTCVGSNRTSMLHPLIAIWTLKVDLEMLNDFGEEVWGVDFETLVCQNWLIDRSLVKNYDFVRVLVGDSNCTWSICWLVWMSRKGEGGIWGILKLRIFLIFFLPKAKTDERETGVELLPSPVRESGSVGTEKSTHTTTTRIRLGPKHGCEQVWIYVYWCPHLETVLWFPLMSVVVIPCAHLRRRGKDAREAPINRW